MLRRWLTPLAALALALSGVAPSTAGEQALGAAGELYRVRTSMDRGHSVLALEILKPGARHANVEIVPGTEDEDAESYPTLVFEETTGAAVLLWQRMASGAFPVLNLTSRDANGWSPVIEVRGNPFAFKTAPQLLVTRDVSSLGEDAGPLHRTVIHVVWAEEDGGGNYTTFYTPLILENGTYVGSNTVFRVASFDRGAASAGEVAPGLLRAPRLQPGSDGSAVKIVFADGDKGRITSVEVRVLPRSLVALGDGARAHIIGADKKLDPKTLANLAATTRAQILSADGALVPSILRALGDEASSFIEAWKPANGGPRALADGARAHIIGVGSDFGRGLRSIVADLPASVVELPATAGGNHAFRFLLHATRPSPDAGDAERYALFGSRDGAEATVAWAQGPTLTYRESAGAGWGPERVLALDGDFNLESALAMLAERTASR